MKQSAKSQDIRVISDTTSSNGLNSEVQVGQSICKAKWVCIELKKKHSLEEDNKIHSLILWGPVRWTCGSQVRSILCYLRWAQICLYKVLHAHFSPARLSIPHSYSWIHSAKYCIGERQWVNMFIIPMISDFCDFSWGQIRTGSNSLYKRQKVSEPNLHLSQCTSWQTALKKETAQNGSSDHSRTKTTCQETQSGRMDIRNSCRPPTPAPSQVILERCPNTDALECKERLFARKERYWETTIPVAKLHHQYGDCDDEGCHEGEGGRDEFESKDKGEGPAENREGGYWLSEIARCILQVADRTHCHRIWRDVSLRLLSLIVKLDDTATGITKEKNLKHP